jgi:hypothetical protein
MAKEKLDIELLKVIEQEVHAIDEKVNWIATFLQGMGKPEPPVETPDPLPETPATPTTIPSKIPLWEREKLEKVEAKPKQKSNVNKRLITLIIVAAALIILSLFLRSQGWTCGVPGM